MATRDGTYMNKMAQAARKIVSEVAQPASAPAASANTTAPSVPQLLPTNVDFKGSLDALKTWYASAFDAGHRYAHSQLFVSSLCFVIVFLILIIFNPPFVQQTLPNQHELDNAPVSYRLVLVYALLSVALLIGWPVIATWAPRALDFARKHV
jgi:hypothetical protein